ncbi:MAG: hypothetical protein M4579_003708 [Chaenotheca gracillima]|nr:MAG: hypothetical protein M4579_003708 [Chaenotheca gracillima]
MSTPRVLLLRPSLRSCRRPPTQQQRGHLHSSSALPIRPHHRHAVNRLRRPTTTPATHFRLASTSPTTTATAAAATSTAAETASSAATTTAAHARNTGTRTRNFLYGTSLALFLAFGYLYVTDTRAGIHQWVVVPSLRWIHEDAEDAHEAGTRALKILHLWGLHPRERGNPDRDGNLEIEVFGHVLSNPIGTSAGIDKHADVPTPLLALGPAIVEIGGVTPHPQEGNPKPRVFRLPSQNALINRYGLNSEGAEYVAMRLRERVRQFAYASGLGIDEEAERTVLDGEAGVPPGSLTPGKLMAVQIAKNKTTPDGDIEAVKQDYVYCVDHLAKYADIIVVNVSSPNTPGLRTLQKIGPLTNILNGVVGAAQSTTRRSKPAVMVKISPDEDSDEQIDGICDAVWASGVDGVIVGNTTKRRPEPLPQGYSLSGKESKILTEDGGYSGPQMFERTLALVKKYRKRLDEGPSKTSTTSSATHPPQKGSGTANSSETSSEIPSPQDPRSSTFQSEANPSHPSETSQPLIRLPDRHSVSTPEADSPSSSILPSPRDILPSSLTSSPSSTTSEEKESPTPSSPRGSKVIFATGGITNGKQALEVLTAGASCAMTYTAVVYGGVGTISRMKSEMREELRRSNTS